LRDTDHKDQIKKRKAVSNPDCDDDTALRDTDHKDQIKKRKAVSSSQSGLDRKVAQQQKEIDELKAKLAAEKQRADKAERERGELRDAILKAQ
jgi:chromosome segregation ATPase